MIPKKIHYCWFGKNPMPKSATKCINSWKKYMPDYEIIEWNEDNFDINYNKYTKEAYEAKKYAFLTDVARLKIIYDHGGLYFDIDVEVIKSFDDLNNCAAFFGLESIGNVATGLGFGAEKNNHFVKMLLDDYKDRNFFMKDGSMDLTPCPLINSKIFKNVGFQLDGTLEKVNDVVVYPIEFFNPMNVGTGRIKKTNNTYSIHWYNKSWLPKSKIIRSKLTKPFHILFGNDCFKFIKKK